MNASTSTSLGTADRRCPSSSLPFSLPHKTALPPCLGFPPLISSCATLPTLLSATGEARSRSCADNLVQRDQSSAFIENARKPVPVGSSNDFKVSDPTPFRYPTSSTPEGSFPTTLPSPYITLPPPSIYQPPQTPFLPSTTSLLPFPPAFSHPPEDLRRMKSSRVTSSGPVTASRNRSRSPVEWRPFVSHSRRNSSHETTPSHPHTERSRRSSQASAHPSSGSVEDSRMASVNPTVMKAEPAIVSTTAYRKDNALVPSSAAIQAPVKSRRVRTGCLTCRERHLKCDEGLPNCLNCRKGSRECKRGLRLNFIDIQMKPIPCVPAVFEWNVSFIDESRSIASEYVGGARRYPRADEVCMQSLGEMASESPLAKRRRLSGNTDAPSKRDSGNYGSASAFPIMRASNNPAQAWECAVTTLPSPLTQERVQALPIAGIGINEDGDFGHVPIKEESYGHRRVSYGSNASSIASSMVPQIKRPSSTNSFCAEMGNSPGGSGSGGVVQHVGTQHPHHGLPDMLPTPPSDRLQIDREAEFGVVASCNDFGDYSDEKEYLSSPDEVLYMQVFMESVGVWMDSLDRNKHFSRIVPFLALKSPMLLNAFLACGVKHMTLVNQAGKNDKALLYYDTATTQLLRNLQNPDRDITECATTAVVLNVYEIMSEKPNDRMSHIAGARALIRECGWNAQTEGVGAACFWLNIGVEVLSCLSFNWPTTWDPDHWGLDLRFVDDLTGYNDNKRRSEGLRETKGPGSGSRTHYGRWKSEAPNDEIGGYDNEIWAHRMFYIVAKIANFRANIPHFQERSPHNEQVRLQNRFSDWKHLKSLCDGWNRKCPRSMKPFGYLYPMQNSSSGSIFPNVWLIERAAVIGRLLYHTAMILLHQINPVKASALEENQKAQLHHAHQVCGLVAHAKDHGIAVVAIRSLVIAALVLRNRHEQDEVIVLFKNIAAETGWRIGKVFHELFQAWQRDDDTRGTASSRASSSDPKPALTDLVAGSTFGNSSDSRRIYSSGPGSSPLSGAGLGLFFSQLQPIRHEFASPNTVAPIVSRQSNPTTASSALAGLSRHIRVHSSASAASSASGTASGGMQSSALSSLAVPAKAVNPLLRADFSLPDHPYKSFYRPPSETVLCSTHIT